MAVGVSGMPLKPYYEHAGITIWHGDCLEILPTLAPVDHVITDPPYNEQTHAGALTNGPGDDHLVDFAPLGDAGFRHAFTGIGRVVQRWTVATVAWQHAALLEREPITGLRFVRLGVWVKPNGTPQFTGDRPAQGWEAVVILHRADVKLKWNGGGRHGVWNIPKESTCHPTGKPLRLVKEFVSLFTDPGDTILDPFMGSGTTLRAAKDLGRRAIGIEIEERYAELAAKRMAQEVLPLK